MDALERRRKRELGESRGATLWADTQVLPELVVEKLTVSPRSNNAYLLRCRGTGRQVLVDAANAAETLLTAIGEDGLDSVVTTHRHADHRLALGSVVAATGAETIAHPADAVAIPTPTLKPVEDGSVIAVGDCELQTVHLRGHTPGSIALLYDDSSTTPHLWSGDSLLPGEVGRTSSPQAFRDLIEDLETKLFDRLPDDTVVHPGHGEDTTLGALQGDFNEARLRGWRLWPHVTRRSARMMRRSRRFTASLLFGRENGPRST